MTSSQALSDYHQLVNRVLDGLADPAVLVDAERHILRFNSAYQLLSGKRLRALHLAAASGLRCADVAGLSICDEGCLAAQALAADQSVRVDEISARPSGGKKRTLIVTAIPIDENLVLEIYRDVTADARIQRRYRSLLEAEKRAKADLEDQVRRRTGELQQANQELKRAQAMLVHQEKMSALGQLVTGIAHELNNPISFVYGNIDFLAEYLEDLISFVHEAEQLPDLPPAARAAIAHRKEQMEFDYLREDSEKLLGSIRTGAQRTAAIVRDLKIFSRSRPGTLEQTDLVEGLESTLNLLTPLLKDRIHIVRDYQEPLPQVRCNAGHVNQVFMNILTNAAQAVEGDGEILIRIRANEDRVRVLLRDTGPGIPYEDLARIFEPFYTTKEAGQGTGMGLAISDGIVRQHGGHLMVETAPGYGATFIVELPVDPEAAAAATAHPAGNPATAPAGNPGPAIAENPGPGTDDA